MQEEVKSAQVKMKRALEHLHAELKKVRTGRANPQQLEGVRVEVYGQLTPLLHIASVNAIDAQMLVITPYDSGNVAAISAAIRNDSSLGFNPADDGKVIRVPIPPLTLERRAVIAKQVSEKAEECRISLRNLRHEILSLTKQAQKDGQVTEDEYHRVEKQIGDLMSRLQNEVEAAVVAKEAEVMSV